MIINITNNRKISPYTGPSFKTDERGSLAKLEYKLRGNSESLNNKELRIVYVSSDINVDLKVRKTKTDIPNVDQEFPGKEVLAIAGPFFDINRSTNNTIIVGLYYQHGKKYKGPSVNYHKGLFKRGFFVFKNGRMGITDNIFELKNAETAFEGFLLVKNGKIQGKLSKYVNATTGSKWHRRYIVEFNDLSFAVIETLFENTQAKALLSVLNNAKSENGATVKNIIYTDMGMSSSGKMWTENGDVKSLITDDIKDPFPASYLLFHK